VSALEVWMNGRHVGVWRQIRGERDQFQYDRDWLADPQSRALSLSLPVTADAQITSPAVRHYFDNLLPDDQRIRDRLRVRFGTSSADTFDLLEAIGRDCVGAVQLLPENQVPEDWNRVIAVPMTAKDVEAHLRSVPTVRAPLLGAQKDEDDFRISIAGAQEKTALLRIGSTWHRPRGATPTTHILKLPLGIVGGGLALDLSDSVDNEWLCAALLAELGLPTAHTEIGRFGSQRVLIVQRFDRRWLNIDGGNPNSARFKPLPTSWIARLPQEDFCQATGQPSALKYEKDGGAGMETILGVLARSGQPRSDQARFVLSQLAFWLLAATDGHAKNFSIFHLRGGAYSLTPLYDVLSAWPVIGPRAKQLSLQKVRLAMAMRAGRRAHYKLDEIQPRHFKALTEQLGDDQLWPAMLELVERIPRAIDRVEKQLPEDFAEPVWTSITTGLSRQAKVFLEAAVALA
jgi:serine/threonine-protein kinase HipA